MQLHHFHICNRAIRSHCQFFSNKIKSPNARWSSIPRRDALVVILDFVAEGPSVIVHCLIFQHIDVLRLFPRMCPSGFPFPQTCWEKKFCPSATCFSRTSLTPLPLWSHRSSNVLRWSSSRHVSAETDTLHTVAAARDVLGPAPSFWSERTALSIEQKLFVAAFPFNTTLFQHTLQRFDSHTCCRLLRYSLGPTPACAFRKCGCHRSRDLVLLREVYGVFTCPQEAHRRLFCHCAPPVGEARAHPASDFLCSVTRESTLECAQAGTLLYLPSMFLDSDC